MPPGLLSQSTFFRGGAEAFEPLFKATSFPAPADHFRLTGPKSEIDKNLA